MSWLAIVPNIVAVSHIS